MRIVHISDLHLRHHLPGSSSVTERLSRAMPDLFDRAVQQTVELAPDLVVLSGDLIDYPLESMDDPFLRQQATADLRLVSELLAPLPCPIAMVYGNHDHPALFRQVFGLMPQDQLVGGYRTLTFLDDEGADHVPVRSGIERNRFGAALADSSSAPQIQIQHYVVWPERNQEYPHTYGDGVTMHGNIVASGNVKLVLSGHYHRGVEPFFDKGVWFSTVRAFGEPPHPYWLYEMCGDNLTYSEHTVNSQRRNA